MPLTPDVPSGDVWDANRLAWTSFLGRRLVVSGRPILLVPKGIVSFAKRYTAKRYHRHFVLTYLQHEHLRLDSVLVQSKERKDGTIRRWVTKESVVEYESPGDKTYLAEFTERHVQLFADFKASAAYQAQSLSNEQLTREKLTSVVQHLINSLQSIPPGSTDATRYHRLVIGILELCFYPALLQPRPEQPIHDGRKRIDITFDNAASRGFFHQLHDIHKVPSAYIMAECKNYSRDVKNPALDQLAGRFGVNRGQFGFLVSRTVDDMETLLARCADAFKDRRGLMIPLADTDLVLMLSKRAEGHSDPYHDLLTERMRRIALS